jgi:hypothetical protein
MLDRFLSFLTSLRLTVFCLACALVLVFAGTLAQVHMGLYLTQERYFHSLFVFWSVPGTGWNVPVWPGGYLIGAVLLVNLIAAHIKRFILTPRKIGLFLIHAGLIMLFLGQFLTESFQVESFMRLEEGETKNYTENPRKNELVVIDTTNPDLDQVVTIPESRLAAKNDLQPPGLPFTIRVKEFFPNSVPAPAMRSVAGGGARMEATQGVGKRLFFGPQPTTVRSDDENVPAALVEIVSPTGTLGTWTVSNWLSRYAGQLRQQLGQMGTLLDIPQQFTYNNRTYRLAYRPVRYYLPYSVTLQNFSHKRYKGTDIPKDFSSRVQLRNPQTGEDREVLIYMNNPLRYAGQTFYQGGFEPGDTVSILQVVRNPAWLTPYLSCTLVGVGLAVQFLIHLVKFGQRKARQVPSLSPTRNGKPKSKAEEVGPAAVALAGTPRATTSFQSLGKRRNS